MEEGVLVVYQNGAGPSLIVSGLNQRVYPNTHCSGKNKSMSFSGSIQTLPFDSPLNELFTSKQKFLHTCQCDKNNDT